jgi:hypothetical protein
MILFLIRKILLNNLSIISNKYGKIYIDPLTNEIIKKVLNDININEKLNLIIIDSNNIPDKLIDKITDKLTLEIVINPIYIPISNRSKEFVLIDYRTLYSLLKNKVNPYTREPITLEKIKELNETNEVKELLEEFDTNIINLLLST